MLQVLKSGAHSEGLQVKSKQGVLQVQYEGPSCKGLQEQEGAVQWHQLDSKKQSFFNFGSFDRASEKEGLKLLVDSGCNGFMLKNRALFKVLDEAIITDMGNAEMSRTRVEG